MDATIPFPLTEHPTYGAFPTQDALPVLLTGLTYDLQLMLAECDLSLAQLRPLAQALCGLIPGAQVPGMVLRCAEYLLSADLQQPIVMVVTVCSGAGVDELEWPLCPPGPAWTGLAAQHRAAAAFTASIGR